MDTEILGRAVFGEINHISTLRTALLIFGTGPVLCADYTGPKSSKKVVSREEAIAIIDDQYRCVLPLLFSLHISWRGFEIPVVKLYGKYVLTRIVSVIYELKHFGSHPRETL